MNTSTFLRSLGGRIVITVVIAIAITLVVCIFVLRSTMAGLILSDLESEMRGVLPQAESVTNSVGDLSKDGAFDYEKLSGELGKVGKENYKGTLFFRTVPVVAAWDVIKKSTDGTTMKFRIVHDYPRIKSNEPSNDLERRILCELKDPAKKEVFITESHSGMIAYGRSIVMSQSCTACHGVPATSKSRDGRDVFGFQMEGWKSGDRQGSIALRCRSATSTIRS